jgi:hypothetical protein
VKVFNNLWKRYLWCKRFFFCSHEITVIEARNIITNTCKRNYKLRNVNAIWWDQRNVTIQERKIDDMKNNVPFSCIVLFLHHDRPCYFNGISSRVGIRLLTFHYCIYPPIHLTQVPSPGPLFPYTELVLFTNKADILLTWS